MDVYLLPPVIYILPHLSLALLTFFFLALYSIEKKVVYPGGLFCFLILAVLVVFLSIIIGV